MNQPINSNLSNIIDTYKLSNNNFIKNSKTIFSEIIHIYSQMDSLYKEFDKLKDNNSILLETNQILSDKHKQLESESLENKSKLSNIQIMNYDLEISLKNTKKLLETKTKTIINYYDITNKEFELKDTIINDFKKYSDSLENKLKALNCKICLIGKVKLAFIPCGHCVTCVNCYNNLEEKVCPICRIGINTTQELFF